MKDLINIFLMAVVVPWYRDAASDWLGLRCDRDCSGLLGKNRAGPAPQELLGGFGFLGLVALFTWQGALVGGLFYGLLAAPKDQTEGNAARKRKRALSGLFPMAVTCRQGSTSAQYFGKISGSQNANLLLPPWSDKYLWPSPARQQST